MVSKSEKAKCSNAYANAEPSLVSNHLEGVETWRHPPTAQAMVKAKSRE